MFQTTGLPVHLHLHLHCTTFAAMSGLGKLLAVIAFDYTHTLRSSSSWKTGWRKLYIMNCFTQKEESVAKHYMLSVSEE